MEKLLSIIPIWIHVLSMAGSFGATILCAVLCRLAPADTESQNNSIWSIPQMLLGATLLTGLALVYLRFTTTMNAGSPPGGHFWGIVSCKVVLLLGTGAFSGIASNKAKTGNNMAAFRLWVAAAISLSLAAFIGLSL